MSIIFDIAGAIESCLPEARPLGLHEPSFDAEDEILVLDCIRSGWVSSVGKYVDQFELDLAAYTGVKRAVVVSNGTAALHLCYQLAGIKPGDIVLCPSLTFVATANAIFYTGATPHFVDVEEATLGICPDALREYLKANYHPHMKALVVAHILGHPARLDELRDVCGEFNLVLIEDAAEGLGSFYKEVHVGGTSLISSLSFNGNKIITTGGGGAVLTNDVELGARAKHLSTVAKQFHPIEIMHDELGYNYRMPNLNAALGCTQLRKLPFFLKQKRSLAEHYANALAPFTRVITEPKDCKSNYWLNAIQLKNKEQRDQLLMRLHEKNIMARPIWTPLDQLPHFAKSPKGPLPVTQALYESVVCLPSSAGLAT